MPDDNERQVPDGAGVLPLIPDELQVHPLLLAVLHATVFLSASDDQIVDEDAADEAFDYMAGYLRRLDGSDLARVREDLAVLAEFGRQEKWSAEAIEFLKTFLETCGISEAEGS
jgi:hypothetical protein